MKNNIARISALGPLLGALACFYGCSDEPTGGASSSSAASSGDMSSSGSSVSSSGSVTSSSSSGMGGAGGAMSTGGAGGAGGSALCDNGTVIDEVDPTKRCVGATGNVATPIVAPANMIWADKVEAVSSEYVLAGDPDAYKGKQALGAPDLYPMADDDPKAWATLEEDDPNEFLEVGFTTPKSANAVWVYETYNPGGIKKITITTAAGPVVIYDKATPAAIGDCAHVLAAPTNTCSPISKVRIDLASEVVIDWNEIDAVGLLP